MTGQGDRPSSTDDTGVPVLSEPQVRVLGALIEKEATVPDTYPMTVKGLVTACNQKNNRDPVVDFDGPLVERTLAECKALGLVRFVHASHGARTTKYRHVVAERLGLEPAELQLLAVMLLRGPNTVNELRVRTERAHGFADNDEVERTLAGLVSRPTPLVVQLDRQPGQKETRWMHLVGGPVDAAVHDSGSAHDEPSEAPRTSPAARPSVAHDQAAAPGRIEALERRVAALEAALGSVLDELGVTGSTIDPAPTDDSEV